MITEGFGALCGLGCEGRISLPAHRASPWTRGSVRRNERYSKMQCTLREGTCFENEVAATVPSSSSYAQLMLVVGGIRRHLGGEDREVVRSLHFDRGFAPFIRAVDPTAEAAPSTIADFWLT